MAIPTIPQSEKPIILDLGCGHNKHPGAIGVDNIQLDAVDVVHDLLLTPYPFVSECADEVIASHVLEHFAFADITRVLSEIRRILKPDGSLVISVPHAGSVAAYTDPTHQTFFTFGSFYYFTEQHPLAYYKELSATWQIERIWTSVNLFNNQFQREARWQLWLDYQASRLLRRILRGSRSMTLPELIVKVFPFWLVSIHVRLSKAKSAGVALWGR